MTAKLSSHEHHPQVVLFCSDAEGLWTDTKARFLKLSRLKRSNEATNNQFLKLQSNFLFQGLGTGKQKNEALWLFGTCFFFSIKMVQFSFFIFWSMAQNILTKQRVWHCIVDELFETA